MEQDTKTAKKKRVAVPANKEVIYARDRIKPRGLWGLYKGKIFYDENEDIFNLGL
jgi:hypothetical protein